MPDATIVSPAPTSRLSRLLIAMLARHMGHGTLTLSFPDGTRARVISAGPPRLTAEITDWRWVRRILTNPGLAFGEAFVDGGLVLHEGTIYEFLDGLLSTYGQSQFPLVALRERAHTLLRRLRQFNPAKRARRNVAHHYDLDGEFYRRLLDPDLQYSCAYFRRGDETLEEAQVAKKRHIAAKLLLDRPGLRVLDIGCGWGGMALTLAREFGADVTGVTLSEEQLAVARERAAAAGLSDRVRFELVDYRSVDQCFDRVVSVGMFEHVGINHYGAFFRVVKRCLAPDGVALIHAIGRSHGPEATNAWLDKYIFPGGYSPALSEVLPAVERSGLLLTDIEILRMHYAKTLAAWRANLAANHDALMRTHDERFYRMMEFYLAGAELAFLRTGHMVWQMQLARREGVVPLTRDYIAA